MALEALLEHRSAYEVLEAPAAIRARVGGGAHVPAGVAAFAPAD
jgi:hypothetical protein